MRETSETSTWTVHYKKAGKPFPKMKGFVNYHSALMFAADFTQANPGSGAAVFDHTGKKIHEYGAGI